MKSHCALIQTEELQAIVGDASRLGYGGQQYCGLWSLSSPHSNFNAFGQGRAGLIPSDLRRKAPILEQVDEQSVRLIHSADKDWPVEASALHTLEAPYSIRHRLSITDHEDTRKEGCLFREVGACCYMNGPEDPRLHFLSGGDWSSYISPRHGVGASIVPSYITSEALEQWPASSDWSQGRVDNRPFHWDRADLTFDEPFYYGRVGDMVMILVFDQPEWLRFFCSPTGGGVSQIAGRSSPAWDYQWVIPEQAYEVQRSYHFQVQLIYKPFISNDDVLGEVHLAQQRFENIKTMA